MFHDAVTGQTVTINTVPPLQPDPAGHPHGDRVQHPMLTAGKLKSTLKIHPPLSYLALRPGQLMIALNPQTADTRLCVIQAKQTPISWWARFTSCTESPKAKLQKSSIQLNHLLGHSYSIREEGTTGATTSDGLVHSQGQPGVT